MYVRNRKGVVTETIKECNALYRSPIKHLHFVRYIHQCLLCNLAFGVPLFSEITGSSKFTRMSNISIQQTLFAA